jgi:hypothetical protein
MMPRFNGTNLPPALRDHLFDHFREREISVEDLYRLKQWRESESDAPEGLWYCRNKCQGTGKALKGSSRKLIYEV